MTLSPSPTERVLMTPPPLQCPAHVPDLSAPDTLRPSSSDLDCPVLPWLRARFEADAQMRELAREQLEGYHAEVKRALDSAQADRAELATVAADVQSVKRTLAKLAAQTVGGAGLVVLVIEVIQRLVAK